jgi:hypothetical protein
MLRENADNSATNDGVVIEIVRCNALDRFAKTHKLRLSLRRKNARLPAISFIAAPLIAHSTVAPLFSIVNWKAIRSASYPKILSRISGIEKLPVTTF